MLITDHLKAINPDTRKLVNVHEFIKEVGINYKEVGKEAICPSCKKQKWQILDEKYESARLNHQWILPDLINKLMKYC